MYFKKETIKKILKISKDFFKKTPYIRGLDVSVQDVVLAMESRKALNICFASDTTSGIVKFGISGSAR